MTTINEIIYSATGLAYSRGLSNEDIEEYLTYSKCKSLILGLLHARGFEYVESRGVEFLINYAFRKKRIEKTAPCLIGRCTPNGCIYRITPDSGYCNPRKTTFRIEVITPMQRCGSLLKRHRIGGRWDDYHYCIKPGV